jgi:hypothetical protein
MKINHIIMASFLSAIISAIISASVVLTVPFALGCHEFSGGLE